MIRRQSAVRSRLSAVGSRHSGSPAPSLRPLASFVLAAIFVFASAWPAAAQDTHLLVITGVGGDDEHANQFHQWATAIIDAAKERGGLTDDTITYLGDKPDLAPNRIKARSTRDNVQKAFVDLATRAQAADQVFIILIGHGSFDGKVAAFNLAGPDLSAEDYAGLLSKGLAQRLVFVNTASTSGGFLSCCATEFDIDAAG